MLWEEFEGQIKLSYLFYLPLPAPWMVAFYLPLDCNQQFTSSSAVISSAGYSSGSYANNLDCQYDIKVSNGTGIRLYWIVFDIKGYMPDCSEDYVEVFIGCGRHSIGRYCNKNSNSFTVPFDMYSADNCLRIKFHSGNSLAGKGFQARYSTFLLKDGNGT